LSAGLPGKANVYPFDPAAARNYLAAAGYSPQVPPLPLGLAVNREGGNMTLAEAIVESLEAAGIPVILTSSSWDIYAAGLAGCNVTDGRCPYQMFRIGWVLENADPLALLRQAAGYAGWSSAGFTDLLDRALGETDGERRAGLVREAEDMLLGEALVIPLLYYERTWLVKPGVQASYPPFGPPAFRHWGPAR
jgi:oligopeptide transport system substrate-binding protein